MSQDDEKIQTGSAEFNTIKAGCGIRFDPEMLDEEAGFDFSGVEKVGLAADESKDKQETPDTE